jgi:hypothetical protein
MYKHFPHDSYSWSSKINLFYASELIEGTLIDFHNTYHYHHLEGSHNN